jgi:hypothetical protein
MRKNRKGGLFMKFFKSYLFVAIGLFLGFSAFAQDLDTVSVSDQFTSGARVMKAPLAGFRMAEPVWTVRMR